MPTTLQSIVVFAVAVVPGFLFVRGFFRGRARVISEQGIYVLAEAVVASLLMLALFWKGGGQQTVGWYLDGQLRAHDGAVYGYALVALLAPFPLGLAVGGVANLVVAALGRLRGRVLRGIDSQRARPSSRPSVGRRLALWVLGALRSRNFLDGPGAWERTWRELRQEGTYVYVRVKTKGGSDITGVMGDGSHVALSPLPRDIYIERVLRELAPGGPYGPVAEGRGIFVAGAEIESIEFRGPEASIPPEAQEPQP